MKILVFGKTGQVAVELGRSSNVTTLNRAAADLKDPAACAAVIANSDWDAVINAAAYTAVDKAEENEPEALIVNGTAPGAMAQACAAKGIPFVHISTDYVFDGQGTRAWQPDDVPAPLGAYGRTKLAGENAVRAAGGQHVILRTSWVFSAHGNNFVKTMLRLGQERDRLTIVADQIGGPTAAADIAAACLEIVAQLAAGRGASGTFHFSGQPNVSWADFARKIFSKAGLGPEVVDIPSREFPTPAKRPANSRMDCSTLESVFGIKCPDWAAALDDVLKNILR